MENNGAGQKKGLIHEEIVYLTPKPFFAYLKLVADAVPLQVD